MCACIYTYSVIQNILMSNKYPLSRAIVHLEIFFKKSMKNVVKDLDTKLYLTNKCLTIDDSFTKAWPLTQQNAKQAPNSFRQIFNDTKGCLILLAKTYTNIFTAVISGSGITEDFYSLCILIFSHFSTVNVYFLCNKK